MVSDMVITETLLSKKNHSQQMRHPLRMEWCDFGSNMIIASQQWTVKFFPSFRLPLPALPVLQLLLQEINVFLCLLLFFLQSCQFLFSVNQLCHRDENSCTVCYCGCSILQIKRCSDFYAGCRCQLFKEYRSSCKQFGTFMEVRQFRMARIASITFSN